MLKKSLTPLLAILTLQLVAAQDPQSLLTPEQESQYQLALKRRNLEVEGFTSDESQSKAAEIFLALAKLGHPNSMHNYASLQYKTKNYGLASEWFVRAANCGLVPSKKNVDLMLKNGQLHGIHLVLGSTRNQGIGGGALVNQLWNSPQLDLTHTQSFNGLAVTFDLQGSDIERGPHIQGDCLRYDFSKMTFGSVYFERPPTVYDGMKNFIADSLGRILPTMTSGAPLTIEWHPYTTLIAGAEPSDINQFRKTNPFNGWDDMNIALQGFFVATGDTKNLALFPQLADRIQERVQQINSLLDFYRQHGLNETLEDLLAHIRREALTILDMYRYPNSLTWIKASNGGSINDFKNAFENKRRVQAHPSLIGTRVKIDSDVGTIYDTPHFLANTFINFILSDISVMTNTPLVINQLTSMGLSDVSVQRQQNPHSKRTNVWMITATKA